MSTKIKLAVIFLFPAFALAQPVRDIGLNQWGNGPKEFAWPTAISTPAGSVAESCVTLTMPAPKSFVLQRPQVDYQINGGTWVGGNTQGQVASGDTICLRTTATATGQTYAILDGLYIGEWEWQLANDARPPQTFLVGPTRQYKQLTDVAPLLVAGDTVELDTGTYDAVEFRRPGHADKPITIEGNGSTIQGDISQARQWSLSLWQSHYYVINDLEITGGSQVCFRNAAHGTVLNNVAVHDCPGHGVLGADRNSGSLTLNSVEVYEAGRATSPQSAMYHAIYVGGDEHAFPGVTLRVTNSHIHDYRGVGIKSRVQNTEIIDTLIEQSGVIDPALPANHSYYAIELIGPDGREPDDPMPGLVDGLVTDLRPYNGVVYGIRVGGDGTGYSYGDVTVSNSTFILPDDYSVPWNPLVVLAYRLSSITLNNNAFTPSATFSLFYNGVTHWYDGVRVAGAGNVYGNGVQLERSGNFPPDVIAAWNRGEPPVDPDPIPPDPIPPDPIPPDPPMRRVELQIVVDGEVIGTIILEGPQ